MNPDSGEPVAFSMKSSADTSELKSRSFRRKLPKVVWGQVLSLWAILDGVLLAIGTGLF